MRTRDLLILTVVLAFAAGIALVLMTSGTDTKAPAPMPGDPAAAEVAIEANPIAAATEQPGVEPAVSISPPGDDRARVDTSAWTSGVVIGDVSLALSTIDRIEKISVIVKELRSGRASGDDYKAPFHVVVDVERGVGTPTFAVRDIPFSPYPYSVSLYSPGLNGGRRTVMIDENTPLHDDLVLAITPGAPFSVLVRDQDRNPYADVEIRLLPTGDIPGRREHIGRTDSFGSVVFESVLAGDYNIVSALGGMQLARPRPTTVLPGALRYGNKIQGQSDTLIVPRGTPLEILVANRAGYGIAGAAVKLQALDTVLVRDPKMSTDAVGRATFPHITPGRWMLTITKPNHGSYTKSLTVKDGELLPRLDVQLVQLR